MGLNMSGFIGQWMAMVKSSSPIFQQVKLVLSGSHWSCIQLEHNSSLRRKCGRGNFQLYYIYLEKKCQSRVFNGRYTPTRKLKEPMPMSQLCSVQCEQLTYCCDTFKLVRVGCTIGSGLRPNQIKSRSSMFMLLCLGLRPHWCIHRKWPFNWTCCILFASYI